MDMQWHIFGPFLKWLITVHLVVFGLFLVEFFGVAVLLGIGPGEQLVSNNFVVITSINTVIAVPTAYWILRKGGGT